MSIHLKKSPIVFLAALALGGFSRDAEGTVPSSSLPAAFAPYACVQLGGATGGVLQTAPENHRERSGKNMFAAALGLGGYIPFSGDATGLFLEVQYFHGAAKMRPSFVADEFWHQFKWNFRLLALPAVKIFSSTALLGVLGVALGKIHSENLNAALPNYRVDKRPRGLVVGGGFQTGLVSFSQRSTLYLRATLDYTFYKTFFHYMGAAATPSFKPRVMTALFGLMATF